MAGKLALVINRSPIVSVIRPTRGFAQSGLFGRVLAYSSAAVAASAAASLGYRRTQRTMYASALNDLDGATVNRAYRFWAPICRHPPQRNRGCPNQSGAAGLRFPRGGGECEAKVPCRKYRPALVNAQ